MTPSGRKQKIAIFSVSAGAGHVRAAQALEAAAMKWYPDVETVHVDLMELVPKLFKTVYADTYIKVVERHPAFWGYLYDKSDRERVDSALSKLRIAVERLNTRKLRQLLVDIAPDHVICTHFLPAQLLARKLRTGSFGKPVWVQVTDFDIHALWLHDRMSGYFAAHEEVAWRMAERGIPADTIHVTGIPIMPVFGEPQSRSKCATEFGLDPNRTTILMMSGGAGVGGIEVLADRLLRLEGDFQIVALAGRNEQLLVELRRLAERRPGRLFPMGFTRVIERLMAASDLAITKPGGLTTSECLAVGLPLIVVSPIPGQEERNADFLLENGAAMKACDAGALAWRVNTLLDNRQRLTLMGENARRVGRPDAARHVLDIVLGTAIGKRPS
ncbi:glycosyltransferase [Geobacter sp. AOG1]|uniref:MGDG synthase family glycosyltransferase n=1 Tax=Geobacter sp. AOG1 TaxID=1566346 RepID=UPI001CC5932C|nr:glycosyltransferase [Geobacter sp. AOG1]GFE59117.1 UDP-glucuronosyltransferase [Geobacter sp. AOG1]